VDEISLRYTCGCKDVWGVIRLPAAPEIDQVSEFPCVPEQCQSCERHSRPCPDREGLYTPVIWSEIKGRPRRVTRVKGTGTKAWEA
jgi:hypothetical protein